MKNFFGTLSLAAGMSMLWDEFRGLIFSEILDQRNWDNPMPELWQNLLGLALIGGSIALFNWNRIRALRKKLPFQDAVTKSGRKVFVSRSIDLSGVSDHAIAETVFVDCELYGDCAIYLESTVFLADGFHIKPNNRFNNAIYLVPDETELQGVLALRNCTLLKCRINTTFVVVSEGFKTTYDPQNTLMYRVPTASMLPNGVLPESLEDHKTDEASENEIPPANPGD